MDAQIINPFLEALLHILSTIASSQANVEKPFIKREKSAMGDVTGIMELTGDITGTISVTFEEKDILKIVSKMFMEDMTELNDEIKDAVGEISNMISGQATQKWVQEGKSIKAKFQSSHMGKGHEITHGSGSKVLGIPMTTENGKITVEVCLNM